MKKLNNSGFGIIETILIVVLATALVGSGVYVYSRQNDQKNHETTAETAPQEQKQSDNKQPVDTKATHQTEDEKILAAAGCKSSDQDCKLVAKAENRGIGSDQDLAKVTIGGDGGGVVVLLSKENGTWKAVYKGNGDVPDDIASQYDFPSEWLGPGL